MSAPVLIAGKWRPANSSGTFRGENPTTSEPIPEEFPISTWADCDAALDAATAAFAAIRTMPAERIAKFLDAYAATIEANADALVAIANTETALPVAPRLKDVELPRTVESIAPGGGGRPRGFLGDADDRHEAEHPQLPGADRPGVGVRAEQFSVRVQQHRGWRFRRGDRGRQPGDRQGQHFASGHDAAIRPKLRSKRREKTEMPPGIVQLIYRTSHADGEKLVADPRTGATGYTGSRGAGLKLKAAADRGRQADLSGAFEHQSSRDSAGALKERGEKLAEEFTGSCLMGTGQFCTNPGLVILLGRTGDAEVHRQRGDPLPMPRRSVRCFPAAWRSL